MNLKHSITSSVLALCALCLSACQHTPTVHEQVRKMRWINPDVFDASKHTSGSSYSFEFDMTFTAVNGENVTVTNCLELALFGEDRVSAPEYIYWQRSEEHTSELQSRPHLVCRLLLEKKKQQLRQPR